MTANLLAALNNPHISNGLFGAPYIRLGALGLIACVGCGIVVSSVNGRKLLIYLYALIGVLALIAVPYHLIRFHTLGRIGGSFAQADYLAVFLGCGLLIGAYLLSKYPKYYKHLLLSQATLFGLLLMTQTRIIIFSVIVLYPLLLSYVGNTWPKRKWLAYFVLAIFLFLLAGSTMPARITSPSYAEQSITYRIDLQGSGLRQSWHRPMFGYGPGNITEALRCPNLVKPSLQKSCHEGYIFNSSHNIFIDRALALGWIGGFAFFSITALAIYKGILKRSNEARTLAYCLILMILYLSTNVTGITIELLAWILIMRNLSRVSA